MITWLQIDTRPVCSFYTVEDAKTVGQITGLSFRKLISVGSIQRGCSLTGGVESANLSVSLDNSDGLLTELFRIPPHRIRALVSGYHNGRTFELFRGVISKINLASEIQMDIEF